MTDDPLLSDLTGAQREAVAHRDGPLLVLAGPGSGKTTVVTRRIAWLVAHGVAPRQILALTFTNKAAGEMRDRVGALVGAPGDHRAPTVATFHSFCARQLRVHAEAAGLTRGYSIYDEADKREAVKQALHDAELSSTNWTPATIAASISRAKNLLLDAEAYAATAGDFFQRSVARVYAAYEKIMRNNAALDFDDLLLHTARLLRTDEAVRTQLQDRFRYLMIDEYQDTNRAQFMIAHTLAAAHRNICVVGDPDQSIYGWRGADIGNILDFEEHYPEAVVIPLGQNFRSTAHIVDAAATLIRNNRRRKHKHLFTELEQGSRPAAVVCADEHHEASVVADFMRNEHEGHGVPWKAVAVLYRVNALSRVLEEAFRKAQIPYVIARGTAFYERKEIRDALAYLRVIANPDDEVSLRRIVNTPTRGIGRTTLAKIDVLAADEGVRLLEGLRRAATTAARAGLSTRASRAVRQFVELIEGFHNAAATTVGPDSAAAALARLVERVVRESGLETLYGAGTEEDRERRENLGELISAAAQFEPVPDAAAPAATGNGTPLLQVLIHFLESLALVSDADMINPEAGSVTLMTLHAAKGLEFSAVGIVGLEENLLPHSRANEDDRELEEERRLCFVGMTRARRRLLLTRAVIRTHRGIRAATIGSRFLGELRGDSVDFDDRADEADLRDDAAEAWSRGRPGTANTEALPIGCIVRHPRFGLGRVESIMRRARGASARIAFPTAGTKTLILEYAPLERVE